MPESKESNALLREENKLKAEDNMLMFQPNMLQHSINESLQYTKAHEGFMRPGEEKSINRMIYEMNEFYIDMVEKFGRLKLNLNNAEDGEEEEDELDTSSLLDERYICKLERHAKGKDVRGQLMKIVDLDRELMTNLEILKNEKMERTAIQLEICDMVENNLKTQQFYDLLEDGESAADNNEDQQSEPECPSEHIFVNSSGDDRFIKRNIQLAPMAGHGLTDEEKLTLEGLLETLDAFDENKTSSDVKNDNVRDNEVDEEGNEDNPFVISSELESELMSLNIQTRFSLEELQKDESEGKYWKTDQRLKKIEEELKILEHERLNMNVDKLRTEVDVEQLVYPKIFEGFNFLELVDDDKDDESNSELNEENVDVEQ